MVTSRQVEVISTITVLTIISTIVFALRIYARVKILKKTGLDDWLMVAAYVWILFNEATGLAQVAFGTGQRDMNITLSRFTLVLKATYAWHLTHVVAICLVKVSILAFYLRLSVERSHQIIIYIVLAITVIGSIVLTGTNIFQCTPISKAWNPLTYPDGCIHIQLNMAAALVFHVITDAAIYLLPMPVILMMRTSTRRKIGLVLIFIVGAVPVAASLARFLALATIDWTQDLMWQGARVNTLTAVELNVALMAACMPALRVMFFDIGNRASSNPTPENFNIPLSVYPSNRRADVESIDTDFHEFTPDLDKPETSHIISTTGVRLSGTSLGRPSESQECIVQDIFVSEGFTQEGSDTDKGDVSFKL